MNKFFAAIKTKITNPTKKILGKGNSYIKRKPFTAFLASLAIMLGLIILSTGAFRQKPQTEVKANPVKEVKIIDITQNPVLGFNATVKKEGIVNIYAQTNGIVNKIYNAEGKAILKNSPILYLASNYNGQNTSSLSKEISLQTYLNTKNTYNDRVNVINKNKEIAEKSHDQSEDLKNITEDSVNRTDDLIDLNESILDTINTQIKNLENSGASDSDTLALRQQRSQVESALNQLKTSEATDKNNIDNDSDNSELNNLKRDVSVKQLDLERKALDLNLTTSSLQYRLAQLTESFNYPASPFTGTIQKVYVKEGDNINPGTLLATVAANNKKASADISLTQNIAEKVDTKAKHTLYIGDTQVEVPIKFVSTEAINGNLYNVSFDIPNNVLSKIADKDNLYIELKLKTNDSNLYPVVPIESIYQTKTHDFVYIIEEKDGKSYAKSVEVELGDNLDGYVEVKKGLNANDKVITTRNISSGDELKF